MADLIKAALRTNKTIQRFHEAEVKAGEKFYEGAIVCRDSTGLAVNGADTAGYEVLGIATNNQADNTNGIDSEINIELYVNQVHWFTTSGADNTWIGKDVYAVDNNLVAITGVNNWVKVGRVVRVESATKVWVYVPGVRENWKDSNGATAFNIPLLSWVGATTDELTVAEVDGTFNRALSSNALTLEGNESTSETETDSMHYHYTVPADYEAGGAITFRARAYIKGAGTIGATKTIDLEAYKQTDGTAGADICATAAQDLTTAYANYDFTITPTGITPGDVIMFKLTTAIQETAGTAVQSDIAWTKIICPTI